MSTTNLTADTTDGHIVGTDAGGNFATARATSTSSDAASANMHCGQNDNAGTAEVYRAYSRYNCAAVTGWTVTGAVLHVRLYKPFSLGTDIVYVNLHGWTPTLAANREANYDLGGTDTAASPLTTSGDGKVAGDWLTVTLDPTWINTAGGYVGLQFMSDNDNNAVDPGLGNDETCEFHTADSAGSEPYIEVTGTAPAGGTSNTGMLSLLGVGG